MKKNKIIGKRFKQWRLDQGLTQKKIAKILDRSNNYISEVETIGLGLSQASLEILIRKLDLDINWLLTGKKK